ncbi:unnamed protein product [Ectocarpus sp. 4 AP-2014]
MEVGPDSTEAAAAGSGSSETPPSSSGAGKEAQQQQQDQPPPPPPPLLGQHDLYSLSPQSPLAAAMASSIDRDKQQQQHHYRALALPGIMASGSTPITLNALNINPAGVALLPSSALLPPPPPLHLALSTQPPPTANSPRGAGSPSANVWRGGAGSAFGGVGQPGAASPPVAATGGTQQPHPQPQQQQQEIVIGAQFETSKDLRVAVEKSLLVNGRGLVCKRGGSRQKKFTCAGCSYVVRAVKANVTGLWKISSIEDPDHPGCLGGRMRPSCEALMDVAVAGAMEVDTSVKASAIHAQLRQQGIVVNLRQVSRAKMNVAKRKQLESEGYSGGAMQQHQHLLKGAGTGGGSSAGGKRRKIGAMAAAAAAPVADISKESDHQAGPELFLLFGWIVHKAAQGRVDLHRLEQAVGGDCDRAVRLRRGALERLSKGTAAQSAPGAEGGTVLSKLPFEDMDYSRIYGNNCENVMGYVPVPVGAAGPLIVDGEKVWIPLATTEGGLVASVNRGCLAISEGGDGGGWRSSTIGGARTEVLDDGVTRAPCIAMPNIRLASELRRWAERRSGEDAGYPLLSDAFQSTTSHGSLTSVTASLAGRHVYLRFKCTTGKVA